MMPCVDACFFRNFSGLFIQKHKHSIEKKNQVNNKNEMVASSKQSKSPGGARNSIICFYVYIAKKQVGEKPGAFDPPPPAPLPPCTSRWHKPGGGGLKTENLSVPIPAITASACFQPAARQVRPSHASIENFSEELIGTRQ
jgi:hypothetical protein